MRQRIGLAVLCLILFTSLAVAQDEDAPKRVRQIAITFNELPASPDFSQVDREGLNKMILDALAKHKVKATGFIVGARLEKNYDIIGQWLNGGHTLGTMTYNLEDLHELGTEKFIEEAEWGIAEIEDMLEGFGQKKRYFRFPFLHYGQTQQEKREVKAFLQAEGNTIAHASIIPNDDLYNFTLGKMGKLLDSLQYVLLRDEYLNDVFDQLERAEMLADEIMGRPVKHVLVLRANRLNAIYLDELLTALEENGTTFITLDAALRDEVYNKAESYFGLRGVGYLDMLAQSER